MELSIGYHPLYLHNGHCSTDDGFSMLADYLLKGLFIGLLAYCGIRCPDSNSIYRVAVGLVIGLAAGLIWAVVQLRRRGFELRQSVDSTTILGLLENPFAITFGVILGLGGAAFSIENNSIPLWLLPTFLVAGLLLGSAMMATRQWLQKRSRFNLSAVPAVLACIAGVVALHRWPDLLSPSARFNLGWVILIGMPFYYALIFVAPSGESEEDAATWCALLWAGLSLIGLSTITMLIFAVGVFFVYVTWLLPRVPAWKAVLRGRALAESGRVGAALTALGAAVRNNPDYEPARLAMWEIHQTLDAARLASEPGLAAHIDPHFCIDRVRELLSEPPTAEQTAEGNHLIDLVESREPRLRATVCYWRAVAATHQHNFELAARQLNALLDPASWKPNDPDRQSILFAAWQLALASHSTLEKQVGRTQLANPGRRMEAIDSVERVLAEAPEDATAWGLKRILYPQLTEAEIEGGRGHRIDAGYLEQLGLASLQDSQKIERGAEYLMMAAQLASADAPRLYWQAAQALERQGMNVLAQKARDRGLQAGKTIGSGQLTEESRRAYFSIVKKLADDAVGKGDLNSAAQLYQTYSEYDRSGFDTVRTLSELHEKRGDAHAALHATVRGLVYNAKDADLLARRDRCLYTILPRDLSTASESVRSAVDVDYCVATAKRLVDLREADTALLDWARHLAELASTLRPGDCQSRLLVARASLRLGERDRATQTLEDIREQRPKKFANAAEENAWLTASRILGDLYLNDFDRPDLAVPCLEDFRASDRSGADTLYKIGSAYERLGDRARAARYFREVIGFDGHPLVSDAREALQRIRAD